jgi:hypothetical protein
MALKAGSGVILDRYGQFAGIGGDSDTHHLQRVARDGLAVDDEVENIRGVEGLRDLVDEREKLFGGMRPRI